MRRELKVSLIYRESGIAMNSPTSTLKCFSEYSFMPLANTLPPVVDKYQLDIVVERLRHRARKFAGLSLDERIDPSRSMQ